MMLPIYLFLLYWWLYRRFVRPAYRRWREVRLRTLQQRVVLLWQFPVAGRVKKNFIPLLGAEGATDLQLALYKHTLKTLSTLNSSVSTPSPPPPPSSSSHHQTQSERTPTEICTEVCWRGAEESRVRDWLDRLKPPVLWRPQFHGDLSLKLAGAAGGALREGAEYVVIVVKEAPEMSVSHIREAFDGLVSGSDMVLGPTLNGGYYCIGLNRRTVPHLPSMFLGLEWDSGELLHHQCLIADRIGLKYSVLTDKLSTTDGPSDLPEFERLTGVSESDLLHPHWTAILSVPKHSTMQQIEASVIKLIERTDSPGNLHMVLVYIDDEIGSTDTVTETLKQRIRSLGATLVTTSTSHAGSKVCASRGNVVCVPLCESELPMHWDSAAHRCLSQPGVVAGTFRFGLDVNHDPLVKKNAMFLFQLKSKILEWIINFLAKNFEKPVIGQPIFLHHSSANLLKDVHLSTILSYSNTIRSLSSCGHIAVTEELCTVSHQLCNWKVLIHSGYISVLQRLGFYK